jgi:hypothetical protein
MKKVMLILSLFFAVINGYSQSVTFKKEMALVDEIPYCLLEKTGDITTAPTFILKNLEGKSLMIFKTIVVDIISETNEKEKDIYINVTVIDTEEKFEIAPAINPRKKIIKDLYAHEVLKDGELNAEGLKQYRLIFAENFSEKHKSAPPASRNTDSNKDEYTIVKRNTNAPLFVIGNDIKQDNVLIGTYKSSDKAEGGNIFETIEIYNSTNQLIARGRYPKFGETVQLITAKDNKSYELKKEIAPFENVKAIAEFLIDRLYL